ncbi:hypothetical protein [Zunongwangia profunda]|jgi:hypothetical protein|uniref:hypothetical protein n=1 Tax=Zunongwangia profunda TaxID=398743 RepID=UPI000C8F4F60|nr:hypothetical protein [Zunongwangia profunda]MAG89068.1 hypothetical protein [Flavobacteriaceae bacterium]MCC4230967.1 hypothetical protein [Zunongwangia profunda]|tara:strand:- start:10084 stop:10749 length:666 start_codon:yes stop_codon:yes gene_type:complete
MKKILILTCTIIICHSVFSQAILEGYYLNPLGDDGIPFKWIRFGNPDNYWAGFMWNNTSNSYGNGNDFTIFSYENRDIVLAPFDGNVILNPRNNNGKIGVGISDPGYKLDVNGTVHAKEVKVDMDGWPDFVFEENHQLPSLKEVQKYIKEHGHLENIPPESDVNENGILLGQMNAKLLQKIEELTLYIIQENQSRKEQQKLIQKQAELIEKLQERVELLEN